MAQVVLLQALHFSVSALYLLDLADKPSGTVGVRVGQRHVLSVLCRRNHVFHVQHVQHVEQGVAARVGKVA